MKNTMTILTLEHKSKQPHWFKLRLQFNPIILNLSRRRFLKIVARQRKAMISMDKVTLDNTLLEIRRQLMRRAFQDEIVGRLFVLLEYARYWEENSSVNVAWATCIMLKGCAVEIKRAEREPAMLLCAGILALAAVPVHWVVADERRAITLAEKNAALFQALNLEPPIALIEVREPEKLAVNPKQVMIMTAERLAQNYLQERKLLGSKPGHLRLLLNQLSGQTSSSSPLRTQGFGFALIEHIDFWLLEKAFSMVEIESGKQQITLHELFRHYLQCAGNLLGSQNLASALWDSYRVTPVTLSSCQKKTTLHCTVFQNLEQKWDAIATKLVQAKQTDEKICLIVTSSESLAQVHEIGIKWALPIVIVKQMQKEATHEFAMGNLLVLKEPFPWLGLEEWLNETNCRLVIADFYDSYRLWHYLERMSCNSPAISIEMLFCLEDKWLQAFEMSSIYKWLQRWLKWQPTVSSRVACWLLKRLLVQAETQRKKVYSDMSRWLWQQEKRFSIFRK